MQKVFAKVFDFLASIELAVFIIISIAVISAAGTIIESKYSTEVAAQAVYRSWFFYTVLFLLLLNLLFVAFSRWPWKKNHIGFLVTHLGLIVLLLGSFVTKILGVDGSIALAKGETARTVLVDNKYINIFRAVPSQSYDRVFTYPVNWNILNRLSNPISWKVSYGEQKNIDFSVLDWWPQALREVKVEEAPQGSDKGIPAVHFRIAGSRANLEEWLFLNGIEGSSIDLGPAIVRFQKGMANITAPPIKRTLFICLDSKNQLQLVLASPNSIELKKIGMASLGKKNPLGWMDFEFQLLEFYPRATPKASYTISNSKKGTVEVIRTRIDQEERWIELGAAAQVVHDENIFYIQYTKQEIPIGFEIGLNDFSVNYYPGSKQAMSYESRVNIPGAVADHLISMNEPLKYNGFTFYQSSYSTDESGEPVISVLSVNKDPGRWIKYAGSILLVLGILLMFYFKPIYSGKSKYLQKKKALEFDSFSNIKESI